MNNFANLQLKTGYTFLKSIIKINDLISFAKKNNLKVLAIAEENVMYSAMEFYKECLKNDIKPLLGLEVKNDKYNFIVYAKNYQGYLNMIKITSILNSDNKEGNILKYLQEVILIDLKQNKDLETLLKADYYVKEGLVGKTIALHDVRFLNQEDALAYHVVELIGKSETFDKNKPINKTAYFRLEKDISKDHPNSINNIYEIVDKINVKLDLNIKFNLKFDTPNNEDVDSYLKTLCNNSLKELFKDKEIPKAYIQRVETELEIIQKMGFSTYFLIVWDYIKYAWEQNIFISPGRGSVGGSLIAYLLRITKIDPIENSLLFERFLNEQRVSMPDIDLDFEDERRNEIIEYIFKKYGKGYVSQIITFQTIKGRSSVRDIARVLKIDLRVADRIAKSIPLNTSFQEAYNESTQLKTLIDSNDENKQLLKFAIMIDGLPRQFSTHAAGLVLSNKMISDICPTQVSGENLITQYSMNYLEPIGLIKFDILGLRNLTILKNILTMIKDNSQVVIDIDNINIKEKKVYELISSGDTSGIFQLESPGMRKVLIKMKPTKLEDIVATSSLFRPGPQENIPSYIKRKNGREVINYIDDSIKSILEPTFGIIVYQEQIMQIVQSFASMSLSKADIFRRAIGKKDDKLLKSLKEEFVLGSQKNGHDDKVIDKVYSLIEKFASYGFNRSHAFGYSKLGYQLAYLKTFYPLEFMTSLLSSAMGVFNKTSLYVQEAKNHKIKILGPSINKSFEDYAIEQGMIRFSLLSIKNVGGAAVREIIAERDDQGEFKDLFDFFARISDRRVSKSVIESLIFAGTLDEFGYTRNTIFNNMDTITNYLKLIKVKSGDTIEFSREIALEPKLKVFSSDEEEAKKEFELLGFYLQSHPLKKIKDILKEKKKLRIEDLEDAKDLINQERNYVVQVVSVKHLKTKHNQPMAFATVEDETGQSDLSLFPGKYETLFELLERGNILLITAKANKRQNISLNVSDIKLIK